MNSHSTKLMTIGAVIHDLARISDFISSNKEISVADYLALNNIFDGVAEVRKAMDSLQLVITLEESEQGLTLTGSRLEGDRASKSGRVVRRPDSTTYWLTADQVTFDEMLNLVERTRKAVGSLT